MLGAVTPDHALDSGSAESESFGNDGNLQALQLMQLQDPFNCIFV